MTLIRYRQFLERKSKAILACVAVLVVAAVIGILRVQIDTRFGLFAPDDTIYQKAGDLMEEAFGETQQVLLLLPVNHNAADYRRLGKIAGMLAEIDGVAKVAGAIPAVMADAGDDEIVRFAGSLPTGEGLSAIIEKDGAFWALTRVQLKPGIELRGPVADIKAVIDRHAPGTVISGEPFLETQLFDYILQILLILPPVALVLLLGIFRFRIGSFRATGLSMVPAGIGAVLTLGALCWIQGTISAISVLVPIYVIVLGSADGLHVTSHVMDELGEGRSKEQAITNTLEIVGMPIILTSLTTMAGFLSLLLIGSPAIREMAITAAAGMLVAGLITWVVLPVLLLHQKPLPSRDRHSSEKLADALWKLRGWPSYVLAVIVILASLPGILRVTADFSMVDMYKARTEVRESIDAVTEITGGAFPLSVLVGPFDPLQPEGGAAVLDLQQKLHDEGVTSSELSIYSLVAAAAAKIPGVDGFPESATLIRLLAGQVEKTVPDLYGTLVSEPGWVRILLYVDNLKTANLKVISDIVQGASAASNVDMYPTGSAFQIMEMNRVIIPQQLRSMALALVLVVMLTALSLRSLSSGIKTAIPIFVTLVGLFGVMGYAGIDLSVVTSIMSGLTVGVGIDYAIHYTSVFRTLRSKGVANPQHRAMSYVATPVLANAIGLSVGFSVMIFSPMKIHTTLSILMWVTMALSAVLSLSLLPTTLGARRSDQF